MHQYVSKATGGATPKNQFEEDSDEEVDKLNIGDEQLDEISRNNSRKIADIYDMEDYVPTQA